MNKLENTTADQWQEFYEGVSRVKHPKKNIKPFATHYAGKNRMYFYLTDKALAFFKEVAKTDKEMILKRVLWMGESWFIQGFGNGVFYTELYGKIKIK
ncbi:MAG: hypothetical protein GY750_20890 [Lentisphaerae bacterium]|nr:hypothetical protein [Lentisphaerota bacterium]